MLLFHILRSLGFSHLAVFTFSVVFTFSGATGVGHGVGVSGHLLGCSDLLCWQPFGVCGEGLSPPVDTSRVLG